MSFFINTTYRSDAIEIMDDLSMRGDVLTDTLIKLDSINKWLGGNAITLNGIKKLIKNHPKKKTLTIVDLGCGSGDMLRNIADFGKSKGYTFKLIGIDANEFIIEHAKKRSQIMLKLAIFNKIFFRKNLKSYHTILC